MSSPTVVRVNTLFLWKEQPYTDPLTKFYLVLETLLGLHRIPLIASNYVNIYFPITLIYSLLLIAGMLYSSFFMSSHPHSRFGSVIVSYCEYIFCVVFGIASWKRVQKYYEELTRFDVEVGCRPKVTQASIRNFVQNIVTLSFVSLFYLVSYYSSQLNTLRFHMIPVPFLQCVELHYYGHLLSLLITRLRLINYYAESPMSDIKMTKPLKVEKFKYFKYRNRTNSEMKKLMDSYHIIIKAYDYLIDAIKWQLLMIITISFISILWLAYHFCLRIIRTSDPLMYIVTDIGLTITKLLPLFSPCMFGDQVHNEVKRLRQLLASRLYENKLDKSSRSAARALLALTETRDLSFSLLHMLEIDISFPFKFMGLILTYLIILLQFEKVINT